MVSRSNTPGGGRFVRLACSIVGNLHTKMALCFGAFSPAVWVFAALLDCSFLVRWMCWFALRQSSPTTRTRNAASAYGAGGREPKQACSAPRCALCLRGSPAWLVCLHCAPAGWQGLTKWVCVLRPRVAGGCFGCACTPAQIPLSAHQLCTAANPGLRPHTHFASPKIFL